MAEGMAWELSPPELREGSKAWPLALHPVGGLHPTLCQHPNPVCSPVGRLHSQACAKLCLVSGQSCAKGARHLCGSCLLDVTLIGLGQAEQRQPGTAEQ